MQREASIEDQSRNCRKFAEREGWKIIKRYSDKAISGAVKDRPQYQQMLTDAESGSFDALLIDDLSRLGRDAVEAERAIRRIEFAGVRIIAVSDGYDSRSKGRKVHRGVKNLFNELYLDDLREKTKRGQAGRILNGNSAGGRAYGYDHIPVFSKTRTDAYGRPEVEAVTRRVNREKAETVKRIFTMYADGHSPRTIADTLNREKIPSPRNGTWSASAIHGNPRTGDGILNNQIYIGRIVWNRIEATKNPETGRGRYRVRPETEWVIKEMPSLRIIPQALWERVRARQAEQSQRSDEVYGGGSTRTPEPEPGRSIFSAAFSSAASATVTTWWRAERATPARRARTVANPSATTR